MSKSDIAYLEITTLLPSRVHLNLGANFDASDREDRRIKCHRDCDAALPTPVWPEFGFEGSRNKLGKSPI